MTALLHCTHLRWPPPPLQAPSVTNLSLALVSEGEAVAQSYYLKLEHDGTRSV